ncbi:hypothetical protein KJ605_01910 [Patescibacteria group bacterium]|nr:hypothetical protein [Patescibacteria group bacterium]MBU1970509.1 hypothetical protein [Patescibacteria group bacterium]
MHKNVRLLFLLVILILAAATAIFLFSINRNDPDAKKSQPSSTSASNIRSFIDPRIQDISFEYDSDIWEVVQVTAEGHQAREKFNYGGVGVLLNERASTGALLLRYTLPRGMGGGILSLSADRFTSVAKDLYRVKVYPQATAENFYTYGLRTGETVVLFNETPEKSNMLKENCADTDGMKLLTDAECGDFELGKIIGYVNQPAFSWSLKKNVLVQDEGLNKAFSIDSPIDYVLIEIRYIGDNPNLSDEIVKQLI